MKINVQHEQKYKTRRRGTAIFLGVVALLGIEGYKQITKTPTQRDEVTFGLESNDWDAAMELAKVEGQSPEDNALVGGLDYLLWQNEGFPHDDVVHPGENVSINIPITQQDKNLKTSTGYHVTVHGPGANSVTGQH